MTKYLVIGTALLAAANVSAPAAMAQSAAPRSRSIAAVSTNSPYLGIGGRDVDAERAKALRLKDVRGVEVTSVMDESPAAKAGFKEGDVILEYNSQPVESWAQLSRLIRETPVGRQVKVGVWRNGSTHSLSANVEARKGMAGVFEDGTWVMPEVRVPEVTIPSFPQMELPKFQMNYQNPMLGIVGEPLGRDDQLADFFGVKEGVLVRSVGHNSAAEKAGMKAGDVIVKIDDTPVNSTRDITSTLRASRSKKTVTVTVVRNKKEMPLTVNVESTTSSGSVHAGIWIGPDSGPVRIYMHMPSVQPIVLTPGVIRPRVRILQFPAQNRVI